MQHLGTLFENKLENIGDKPTARSEYEEILLKFVEAIEKSGRKKIPRSRVGQLLSESGLKKPEHLYHFYRECEKARNFTAFFLWSLTSKA